LSLGKIRSLPVYSEVHLIDGSHELFNSLVKMISLLPDLVIPSLYHKDANRHTEEPKEKKTQVFLGVFVNRKVQVQTDCGSLHNGILKHADSIGVFFEPEDGSAPIFITWHEIRKVIIPKEEKK
ncbi:MAG TPA: hypothetical protein VIO11_03860, partial [Candidatus Methanoperedens sp.]